MCHYDMVRDTYYICSFFNNPCLAHLNKKGAGHVIVMSGAQ